MLVGTTFITNTVYKETFQKQGFSAYKNKILASYHEGSVKEKVLNRIQVTWVSYVEKYISPVLIKFNKKYWVVEDPVARANLPLFKTIPKARKDELTIANGFPKSDSYINWHRSHGDMGSSRYSLLSQINKENVKTLEVAWTYHSAKGSVDTSSGISTAAVNANPVIANGLIFTPTSDHNIVALNASNGQEVWKYISPEKNPARRGLIWYPGKNERKPRIYFPAGRNLYALDAETGKPILSFGSKGKIKSDTGNIAPTIAQGLIINATRKPAINAYDVITGKHIWTFNILEKGMFTFPGGLPEKLSGANPWAGMALDEERGVAFISTGNPVPEYKGVSRPGRNRHANSIIALDIKTGHKIWVFQEVRHDLWDLDIPASPVLTTIFKDGLNIDVVATVTKKGNILLLDRMSGKPIFDFRLKRAPTSKISGEKTWPYQPALELPEPFAKQDFLLSDVTNIGEKNRAYVLDKLKNANIGFFPTLEPGKRSIVFGINGGAEWPGATVDHETGILYVSSNDLASEISLGVSEIVDETQMLKTQGRVLYLEKCSSCHGKNRGGLHASPTLINIGHRYSRDTVSNIIKMGIRSMPALKDLSNTETEEILQYLYTRDSEILDIPEGSKELMEVNASLIIRKNFTDNEGFPANRPPWGTLNAINLNTGRLIWKVPLGESKELIERGLRHAGTNNIAGGSVTAGGLVFVSGTKDKKIRAFDSSNGAELWSYSLPYSGSAPPSVYQLAGQQYIVVVATGSTVSYLGKNFGPEGLVGDAVVAFKLPN